MGKKKLLGLSALLLFVQTAAAQSTGGIIPMILEIFGLPVGNIYTAIGTAAIIGEMILLLYIPFKIGARKLDLQKDMLGQGSRGGRNLALILSTLMVLSLLGVSAQYGGYSMSQAIQAYGALSLVAVFGVLIVALFTMLYALSQSGGIFSMVKGGGMSLKAGGKERQAEAKIKQKEAQDVLEEARNLMGEAEDEEEDSQGRLERLRNRINEIGGGDEDDEEEVAQELRHALNILERVEEDFETGIEDMMGQIDTAVDEFKDAFNYDEDDDERLIKVDERMQRIDAYMNILDGYVDTSTSPPNFDDAGLGFGGGATSYQINDLVFRGDDGAGGFSAITSSDPGALDNWTQGIPDIINGRISNTFVGYSMSHVLVEYRIIEKNLRVIYEHEEYEEDELGDAVKELDSVTQEALEFHNLLKSLVQLVDQLEEESEEMEQIAEHDNFKQLYNEEEDQLGEEHELEERIANLEDAEEELDRKIEEGVELLNKHFEMDEEEIDNLKDIIHYEGDEIEHFSHVWEAIKEGFVDSGDTTMSDNVEIDFSAADLDGNLGGGGLDISNINSDDITPITGLIRIYHDQNNSPIVQTLEAIEDDLGEEEGFFRSEAKNIRERFEDTDLSDIADRLGI